MSDYCRTKGVFYPITEEDIKAIGVDDAYSWSFKNGRLDTNYSFNYAEHYGEENYKRKVW